MGTGAITTSIDVAQLVLYAFWIFFFALVYYLIRENHREGYPMDNDAGILMEGWPRVKVAKVYKTAEGHEVVVPRPSDAVREPLQAERVYRGAGSPIEPTGDPLSAGVGPGSWSSVRPDHADLDFHGEPKIAPLSQFEGYGVSEKDPDPRGMPVYGADGEQAGVVRDLWIDRGEALFRYIDVEVPTASGSRRVLVPMPFAKVTNDGVEVNAILASQFAGAPTVQASDRITMAEEERLSAYFGAGTLYAEPGRAEAWF
jgi:photosynthetic reaction center H subunit